LNRRANVSGAELLTEKLEARSVNKMTEAVGNTERFSHVQRGVW